MGEFPLLPRRIPYEIKLGARASFSRTLTEADGALFIGATWDVNPLHTDDGYAAGTPFGRRIVPGLLTASLATHLGGLLAFLASEMRFQFLRPVFYGETITAEALVSAISEKGEVTMSIRMTNARGELVLLGEARGFPGKFEEENP